MNIRPARYEDCAAIYAITQDQSVREASTRSEAFDYASHCAWWDRRFNESGQRFYVADCGIYSAAASVEPTAVVGYVRYGRVPGTSDAEIAIAVAPHVRRSGLALRMLQETEPPAARDLGVTRFIALVLVSNTPSQKLFEKAGYRMTKWQERFKKQHQRWEKTV